MRLIDKIILVNLMDSYSLSDIIKELSDISFSYASKMSDLELSDKSKRWSQAAFILQSISENLKI